jgi:hypothetical protein
MELFEDSPDADRHFGNDESVAARLPCTKSPRDPRSGRRVPRRTVRWFRWYEPPRGGFGLGCRWLCGRAPTPARSFRRYLTGGPSAQNPGSILFSPVRVRWSPKPKQAAPWLSKLNSCSGSRVSEVLAIRLEPGGRLALIIVIGEGGRIEPPTPAFSGR